MHDALIIGGGVVGLSILRSSLLAGLDAVLVERNPDLCDGASGRNSGVLCTGVDAPDGSLERALIRDSISRARAFCEDHNVPARECGSLVCSWPWDGDGDGDGDEKKWEEGIDGNCVASGRAGLEGVLRESHVAGDKGASLLSSEEVAALEPSLSPKCRGAVHIPGETVVDPWLFCLALAVHSRELARHRGTEDDVIRTGREVLMESSNFDADEGVWHVVTRRTTGRNDADEEGTVTIKARCVVNASGIDCDLVQSGASSASGDVRKLPPPSFEARPRRGQYLVFAAPSEEHDPAMSRNTPSGRSRVPATIPTRPIQPVPSRFTKGIFVYSTLYDQVVVGPTAEDQESRTYDEPDARVAEALAAHASRVLGPDFAGATPVGEYVGIRPGTSEGDYRIRLHPGSNFVTAGGIRSTGLTASLGIGRHVVRCLLPAILPDRRFDDRPRSARPPPAPLPDARELAREYRERGDGTVVVGGRAYRVTHPLTRMGWEAGTGLAAP